MNKGSSEVAMYWIDGSRDGEGTSPEQRSQCWGGGGQCHGCPLLSYLYYQVISYPGLGMLNLHRFPVLTLFFYLFIYFWLRCVLAVAQSLELRPKGSILAVLGLSCPIAWGILVPRPQIKTTSSTLQGGFLTTKPPGKSPYLVLIAGATNSLSQPCTHV